MTACAFDPMDPAQRRDPYPLYRRLRDESPVAFSEKLGWFMITRHSDVARVLGAPQLFSSSPMKVADSALIGRDPPDHGRVRHCVARAFDAKRIRSIEARVKGLAQELTVRALRRRRVDLMAEWAFELPLRVLSELMDIEPARLPEVAEWSKAMVEGAGLEHTPARRVELADSARRFRDFCSELLRRRRAPGHDIVSALLTSGDGQSLTESELCSVVRLLLVAGNETTSGLLGNALLVSLTQPGLLGELRRRPETTTAWVEETLRYDAPVQLLLRRATQSLDIAGCEIPEGSVVAAWIGSANRDERYHLQPDSFVLTRRSDHLGFGAGPHYCLGARLAKLEATLALTVLLDGTLSVALLEAPEELPRLATPHLRCPTRLMVELT